MSPRPLRALVLLIAVCVPVAAQDAAPGPVTAQLEWEPGGIGSFRAQSVEWTDAPPDGTAPLAGIEGAEYATLRIGDVRPLLLARDPADAKRLWIDIDFDGDLLDERPRKWARSGTTLRMEPTVLVPMSDDEVPVPVPLYIYHPQGSATAAVQLYPKAHREGEVVLAGRLRKIALGDGSGDLCFDDRKSDVVYVDVDGDGAFSSNHGSHERIHFGGPFRIGDTAWDPRVTNAAGSAIEFHPVAELPEPVERRWRKSSYQQPGRTQTKPAESFEELLERFEAEREKTYAERNGTILSIGRTGHEKAPALLLRVAAGDKDKSVRGSAVRALGNPLYVETVGADVVKLTRDDEQTVAAGAAQALYDMGHPDRVSILIDLLGSSQSSVVGNAARYLAYEHTDEGRAAVLRAARELGTPVLRYQAYMGARYLPEGPPVELMLAAARDEYVSLRARGLEDLFVIAHPATKQLALSAAEERPVVLVLALAVVRVLGAESDAESVQALIALAGDGVERVRSEAVKRLMHLRERAAVNVLLDALRSKEPAVRTLAAQILAGIPEDYVTPVLIKRAGRERDEATLAAMLEALGDHRHPSAAATLLKAAKLRKRPLVRNAAIRALAMLGMELPEVRKFFLKLLGAKSWEDRIFAIDAAAVAGDAALLPKLISNLGHARRQVRLAVAQAFVRMRPAKAVKPMIDRLGKEDLQRVRNELALALFRTTGMNLYDVHDLWMQWWKDSGGRFKVPDTIPRLPPVEEGGTGAAFYGIAIDSDHVSFVIDQSGSMSAADSTGLAKDGQVTVNRLEVAVQEVLRALAQLDEHAYANVILFHSAVYPWKDELKRLTPAVRKDLRGHLLKQRPTGGTNLYDGLEAALLDPEVDTVMLLSDGVPGAGKYVATDDILRAVRRLNQTRRIVLHCVSLGRDSALLRRLAAENGGSYARK